MVLLLLPHGLPLQQAAFGWLGDAFYADILVIDKVLSDAELLSVGDMSSFYIADGASGITITADSESYSVSFYDASIDLTGEVAINAESQVYQVQFFDGRVSLIGGIEVQAQAQNYNVNFFDASVQLSGEISVIGGKMDYSVSFFDAAVSITELWTDKSGTSTIWTDK